MKTFASLFTGGGLADVGAMQAGYELLWGVELDPDIAAVANQNLPHKDTVHVASVIGFDWSLVKSPDHLHMSPPCQDFSVAKTTGKKANPNDEIADACIEAINTLKPNSVTLENVEGYRKAKGFQKIVDTLWGLGYWVNVDVLNAADFGVPQSRRRLILRAVRGGFPLPLPPKEPWKGWYEAIEDLIPDLPETQFAEWQLKRLPDELKTVVVDGKANDNGKSVTVVPEDKPMFCVSASASKQGIRAYAGATGRVVRMMPRALARFQTLPDGYTLPEKNALACKIIGNGIPCLMMQKLLAY